MYVVSVMVVVRVVVVWMRWERCWCGVGWVDDILGFDWMMDSWGVMLCVVW